MLLLKFSVKAALLRSPGRPARISGPARGVAAESQGRPARESGVAGGLSISEERMFRKFRVSVGFQGLRLRA